MAIGVFGPERGKHGQMLADEPFILVLASRVNIGSLIPKTNRPRNISGADETGFQLFTTTGVQTDAWLVQQQLHERIGVGEVDLTRRCGEIGTVVARR